jgi:hypothetical protein
LTAVLGRAKVKCGTVPVASLDILLEVNKSCESARAEVVSQIHKDVLSSLAANSPVLLINNASSTDNLIAKK